MRKGPAVLFGLLVAMTSALTGCALQVPTDPNGTLRDITGGVLRVGVTDSGTWVQLEAGQDPSGIEPDLVREFADIHDADIEWVEGSEHELVDRIKHEELDLIIGGLTSNTPWTEHAGVTTAYATTVDQYGTTVEHVMLVPMGENAFLLELDRFLQDADIDP